jgi:hypothetical protein
MTMFFLNGIFSQISLWKNSPNWYIYIYIYIYIYLKEGVAIFMSIGHKFKDKLGKISLIKLKYA